jgi:hypothetical protein
MIDNIMTSKHSCIVHSFLIILLCCVPAPSFSSLDPSNPHAGVTLAFSNGKSYCNGHTESVFVRIACDPNEDGNKFGLVSETMTVRSSPLLPHIIHYKSLMTCE